MSTQLDILALEPFYGGIRRHVLETVIRCSRHRWTLLKLPPRRIERRLTVAAHWFAEQLSRHWVGRTDVLFTSEAMNLADLYRLIPMLARKPSVVYFHDNQLPDPHSAQDNPLDFVNLNTATAATEIWFNSMHHLRTFLNRASAFVSRHPEIATHNPMAELTGKSHLMHPPIDIGTVRDVREKENVRRDKRRIFVETRDANVKLLNNACSTLHRRGEQFQLITVGPVEGLSPDIPRTTTSEIDELGHVRALLSCGIMISTRLEAMSDLHAVRALAAGCWPIFPHRGVYRELLPDVLHSSCLYDGTADQLASRIQDVWHQSAPEGYENDLNQILRRFDSIAACKAIDERLEEHVIGHSVGR